MYTSPSLRSKGQQDRQTLSWVPRHLLEVPAWSPERLVLSHLYVFCGGLCPLHAAAVHTPALQAHRWPPCRHMTLCRACERPGTIPPSPGALSSGLPPQCASASSTARNTSVRTSLPFGNTFMYYDPQLGHRPTFTALVITATALKHRDSMLLLNSVKDRGSSA